MGGGRKDPEAAITEFYVNVPNPPFNRLEVRRTVDSTRKREDSEP